MKFDIDLTGHTPAYLQIIQQVKRALAAGRLKPGDQLPTVRRLAAELRVNFNTVARAYRLLDKENIISTQHGRGTYILAPSAQHRREGQRRKELLTLADQFISAAASKGLNAKDLRELLKERLAIWEKERAQKNRS